MGCAAIALAEELASNDYIHIRTYQLHLLLSIHTYMVRLQLCTGLLMIKPIVEKRDIPTYSVPPEPREDTLKRIIGNVLIEWSYAPGDDIVILQNLLASRLRPLLSNR